MKLPFSSPFRKYTDAINAAQAAVSTLDVIRNRNSDPDFIAGIARLYRPGTTDYGFLDEIVWAPPTIPAPHLGFQVRPGALKNMTVNAHGFRDARGAYNSKPDGVYRVFITGGSSTFGSGTSTQQGTIAGRMEAILNETVAPTTGRRYEVVNAGVPGVTGVHEHIIIHTRITGMKPDRVIMFSGHNDIHYAWKKIDPSWRWVYSQHNYMMFLSELYKDAGLDLGAPMAYFLPRRLTGAELADQMFRNAMTSALSVRFAGADLVYALQPDIWSTRKPLNAREQAVFQQISGEDLEYWRDCQENIRNRLSRSPFGGGIGYGFLDLSQMFEDQPEEREIFIDSCHFDTPGNDLIARRIVGSLTW